MRRSDREITQLTEILTVMEHCTICRLGFWDGQQVYVLPLNFGFTHQDGTTTLYFHGAREGRKIDLIQSGAPVGFEMDTNYQLNTGETACDYSAAFQSIIGNGVMAMVEDASEKTMALNRIMYQNTGKDVWHYPEAMLSATAIFKLTITSMTCKFHH